ncbi:MAG: hypothetical protein HYZ28_11530 [Myxococcales bacterium]|nr:hypothetical protein [Myxococcales bacterium]
MPRSRVGERLPAGAEEKTKELTGFDADPSEAAFGSAGDGASMFGADLTGGFREAEEEPNALDILPDHIERLAGSPLSDEEHLTARPTQPPSRDELERELEEEAEERPQMTSPEAEKA